MDLLRSITGEAIAKALDGETMRHKALASNLANAETPNYHRQDVKFEAQLAYALNKMRHPNATANVAKGELRVSDPRHINPNGRAASIQEVSPQVEQDNDHRYRNDGNSVDVESELVMLTKNTQRYLALASLNTRLKASVKTVLTNIS
jgi:flagellar basal-body rod protein FlgB